MKKNLLVLSTGFALFSMFFGSGNLVFPLLVGRESGTHFMWAALGIVLTGVFMPFLGALGMMLYNGSSKLFFQSIGKTGAFIFSLIALSLMGPFGVMPRCLTVAHGSIEMIFPGTSLIVTGLVFCALIYLINISKNKVIPALGVVLTPMLLLSIGLISFFAIKQYASAPQDVAAFSFGAWKSFKNGFFQGYQTMDLLAAFFFSGFVIAHLQAVKSQESSEKSALKTFFQSTLLGGGVLALVYVILVALGSFYAPHLTGIVPQQMLGTIAVHTLGSFGAPCLALVVVLACLTTAIVLVSLFADFLRKEICREKINNHVALLTTLAIGCTISAIGFSGIAKILGPIVEVMYPALIVMTVVNIAHKFFGIRNSHWPATLTLVTKLSFLGL